MNRVIFDSSMPSFVLREQFVKVITRKFFLRLGASEFYDDGNHPAKFARSNMKKSRAAIILFAVFVSFYSLEAAETLTPNQVRAAMQAERSKIVSGRFVANGRYKELYLQPRDEKIPDGWMTWKYEFDYADDYFLFDRNDPRHPGVDAPDFVKDPDRLRTFFAGDRLSFYAFEDRGGGMPMLHVYNKDDAERQPSTQFRRLEVRGIGFLNDTSLIWGAERGDRIFFEHPFVLERGLVIKVKRESESILKLWRNSDPQADDGPDVDGSYYWVDVSRGFIPVRHTTIDGGEISKEERTEWKSIDGVWVPTLLTSKNKYPVFNEDRSETLYYRRPEFEMQLDWEWVNQDIGTGKLHDYREFDIPDGVPVHIDRKLAYVYGEQPPTRKPRSPPVIVGRSRSVLPLSLGSLVILLIVFTIWKTRSAGNG